MKFFCALIFSFFVLSLHLVMGQKQYSLSSPNQRIEVRLSVSDSVRYEVYLDKKELISSSAIALDVNVNHNRKWRVSKTTLRKHDGVLYPVVWQKSKAVAEVYTLLQMSFNNGLTLEWKAFNNGVAWRWNSMIKGDYLINNEVVNFNFKGPGKSWYPQEEQFFSHNEREYKNYTLDKLDDKKLASLPALFQLETAKVLLTEADLFNYAGMWLRGTGKGGVKGVFPGYPTEKQVTSDRDEQVKQRAAFIAKINGYQSFPWRIMMISVADKDILGNQMPYLLGRPSTGDYSWVKPGKVQWDWWHYNNVYEVDFKSGINNDTYKYYIDVASKYGIEYVLLDEGWCDTRDLLKQAPGIDIAALSAYARSKNVDLLLWSSWLVLDKQLDVALDQFQKWGIKGIKVDFMQRDDQDMVNYYEKVAIAAAKRKMLVDFHGAYKPTGWSRTYPNIMTSEGVLGNEISKFAGSITPGHTSTLPFTRMAAGPRVFNPGGIGKFNKKKMAEAPTQPKTRGSRCIQKDMYVVYESPLQMLCDIPTHYLKEAQTMEFIKTVPAVWEESIPLDGKVGEFVSIARKAGNGDWYLGAMTDWNARTLSVELSFLAEGNYEIQIWKDGINADKNAKDLKMESLRVNRDTIIPIVMASGGGYVARITKIL
jgi:alpha-glucosidase